MAFLRQLSLLLWKNWILQKRKCFVTILEIFIPVALAAMIVGLRAFSSHSQPQRRQGAYSFHLTVTPKFYQRYDSVFLYAPDNPLTRNIMNRLESSFMNEPYYSLQKVLSKSIAFPDEESLVSHYNGLDASSAGYTVAAIVFDGDFTANGSFPKSLKLKIRPRGEALRWKTEYLHDYYAYSDEIPKSRYSYESARLEFLSVQYAVMTAIIEQQNASANVSRDARVELQTMPYIPFYKDYDDRIYIAFVIPVIVVAAFFVNALQITKNVVFEKEKKLKASMRLMGLSNFTLWIAWFIKCFIYLLLIIIIFTIFFVIPVTEDGYGVIGRSDGFLFFCFLLCYIVSVISFCFLVSVFFKKANNGAAVSGVLFLLSYFPCLLLLGPYYEMSRAQKLACCLIPNIALSFGCNAFSLYQGPGDGAHWGNFHLPASTDDDISLLAIMTMLLVDSGICLLITWYVDAVFPGEFGVPQPFYFPILKSYWCKTNVGDFDHTDHSNYVNTRDEFFENDPTGQETGINIHNLRKEFGRGKSKKLAVNGVSLNIYKGQITALLGHNGAGKTTTMSVLAGYIPATSGTAIVNGFDVNKNIADVRGCLGLCPQHDILFDTLTVREHLVFFAKLKGTRSRDFEQEVATMIEAIGLKEKSNSLSMTLSGGQKRKLSVGIALIGGSKIVILDEPTSGLDPQARRQIWTLLKEHKENRTILFTTHQMDEADILGDRIAIMAEGVVKCCGTPLFLKSKYGSGYQLTIGKGSHCDVSAVTRFIQEYVPAARLKNDIGGEPVYILPNEESPKFERLFHDMEQEAAEMDISSFGLGVTTMEDVFLRVGESAMDESDDVLEPKGLILPGVEDNRSLGSEGEFGINLSPREFLGFNHDLKTNRGMIKNVQQFQAAFIKKALHTWRNPFLTFAQLFLTIIFYCVILGIVANSTSGPDLDPEPSLALTLSQYGPNYVVHAYEASNFSETKRLNEAFVSTIQTPQSKSTEVDLSRQTMDSFYRNTAANIGVRAYNRFYLIGGSFRVPKDNSSIFVLEGTFNREVYHTDAIVVSHLMNTLLKYYVHPEAGVSMVNHPLPPKEDPDSGRFRITTENQITPILQPFCMLLGLIFLTSTFVIFLIRERQSQAKHIQIVSGLRPLVFWLANLSWDFINYLIPSLCLLIVFVAFQFEVFGYEGPAGGIFVALLVFGWVMISFAYVFSFIFKTPACAMVFLILFHGISGFLPLMIILMVSFDRRRASIAATVDAMDWIFGALFPSHCWVKTFMNIDTNYACRQNNINTQIFGCQRWNIFRVNWQPVNNFAFDSPGIGRYILLMVLQGISYSGLVLLIEYGVMRKICCRCSSRRVYQTTTSPTEQEDSDVAQESARIDWATKHSFANSDSLVLHNLSKYYREYLAVDRLCLGVPQAECFGLLGVNGAGKTSTFKMLTGAETASDGNAFINGYSIRQDLQKVHENIAYCPQFDALVDQMTGRETLTMYARIRGITRDRIGAVVKELLQTFCFEECADREVQTYSGGNKRKLSTAIALIGDPPVIFLDEPTAGVDPAARRQIWNVLSKIRASGRTLILTSHSMEECDALCTRIAIMVNGRFLCLGSPQHLKNKFGQGYTVIARLGESDTEGSLIEAFRRLIETTFPEHQKLDTNESNEYVSYHLTNPNLSLSYIFGALERAKRQYNIEDYSVSQTTLQQVFIGKVTGQVPPQDVSSSVCKRTCCMCCCC